jgi:hypothetical protein
VAAGPNTISTRALVALPVAVSFLLGSLFLFGNIHGSGTFLLVIALLVLVVVSLPVVPIALLHSHRTWNSDPSQKSMTNLAKIASGWLYLIGLSGLIAHEVVRSW